MQSGFRQPRRFSALRPREGAGPPKVTQPRRTEATAAARSPISARWTGGAGVPHSPGSSRSLAEHRPGRAEPAGRRREVPPEPHDPGLRPGPRSPPSPPRLPGIRIRPEGTGGARALKGDAQFPGWQGGLGEELESPDPGRDRSPVGSEQARPSRRSAEAGPRSPGGPASSDTPSPPRLGPTVPWVPPEGLGCFKLHTPSPESGLRGRAAQPVP